MLVWAKSLDDFKEKYNNIWHYEGSEEQRINLAIAEQTRQSILSQRGRSSVQKTQKVAETLENTGKSGIIKVGSGVPVDLQLFAEADIQRQASNSLKRAIKKYETKISEHEAKINNPADYISDWENKDEREQRGLVKHWQKEIRNFEQSINDRIDELKARGDYDE